MYLPHFQHNNNLHVTKIEFPTSSRSKISLKAFNSLFHSKNDMKIMGQTNLHIFFYFCLKIMTHNCMPPCTWACKLLPIYCSYKTTTKLILIQNSNSLNTYGFVLFYTWACVSLRLINFYTPYKKWPFYPCQHTQRCVNSFTQLC